jgi:hypothetical protein
MDAASELLNALRRGDAVRRLEPLTDHELARADLLEQLRQELAAYGAWLDDATDPLAPENADLLGWADIEFCPEEGESA